MLNKLIEHMIKCTELSAIESYKQAGLGNTVTADKSAVDSMRVYLNSLDIDIRVVIGEGERDKAPMLFMGESLGDKNSKYKIDIAVDPLECTTVCSELGNGSYSIIGFANRGDILYSPDVYMKKIVISKKISDFCQNISIDNSITDNLRIISEIKKCNPKDITVIILDRERHIEMISEARKFGSRIKLIKDGDIFAALNVIDDNADMYIGTGGAPEGVISSMLVNSLGGYMEAKLIFDDQSWKKAMKVGINDKHRIYKSNDLVKGSSVFVATAVTDGDFLSGIKYGKDNKTHTESLVIYKNTIRKIKSNIIL